MSNDETGLDRAALDNLRDVIGGDDSILAELVDSFLDDAPRMLDELHHGVANGDTARVQLNAHSLKGNAADFGALTFAELCRQLEYLGKSGELDGAPKLLNELDAEFQWVEMALTRLLDSLR